MGNHLPSILLARSALAGEACYTSDFFSSETLYVKMRTLEHRAILSDIDFSDVLPDSKVKAAASVLDFPGLSGKAVFDRHTELAAVAAQTELAAAKSCMKIRLTAGALPDRESAAQKTIHGGVEPYTVIAWWEDDLCVIRTSSIFTAECRAWAAKVLNLPEEKLRVCAPMIGGFEGKGNHYCREALCALLAKQSGCPVRYELTRKQAWAALEESYDMY